MEEKYLIKILQKQNKKQLINLLVKSFNVLNKAKRYQIFNDIYSKEISPRYNSKIIFSEVNKFYNDSISKKYYAPFDRNSKNFSHIPEETELWCDIFANLLKKTMELTIHKDHDKAVQCFDMLFYLHENMCEEIVFADELGPWMISIKYSQIIPKYIESMAFVCTPEEFKKRIKLLMMIDNYEYNKLEVFNKAMKAGNQEQKKAIIDLNPE